MNFSKLPKLEKKEGFLDSEESIRKARLSLEKRTKEDYERYEKTKRIVREEAHKKLLD